MTKSGKHRPVPIGDLFDEDEGPLLEAVEPGRGPDAQLGLGQSAERFDALVGELPEHYQAILYLRYREDLSYDEIADSLSVPLGTVKVRLHRAHEILRRKLTARGMKP